MTGGVVAEAVDVAVAAEEAETGETGKGETGTGETEVVVVDTEAAEEKVVMTGAREAASAVAEGERTMATAASRIPRSDDGARGM